MPVAFFRVESSIVTEASERTGGRIDHVAAAAAAAVRLCLNPPFSLSHCLTKRCSAFARDIRCLRRVVRPPNKVGCKVQGKLRCPKFAPSDPFFSAKTAVLARVRCTNAAEGFCLICSLRFF